MFETHIGSNVEVYADDTLVKSKVISDHIRDLEETFGVLLAHRMMKLNLAKCAFRVNFEKLLGFIASQRGIKASPKKIRAILDMSPPRTMKEVQKLKGQVAALSRFLTKFAEKRSNLQKLETFGQLAKWAIELGEFDVEFQPWPALKGKTLADFTIEAATLAPDAQDHPKSLDMPNAPAWIMNVDGSSTQTGSGARVVLSTPDGTEIKYSITLAFLATNSMAKYEALLRGLRHAKECSVKALFVLSDSELVVNQIQGAFEVSNS
ncbi:hypothetical protein Nepgr_026691 [Nepenthes gracilis]|uniref:RNase H type-1 domain-containing protein n=1 Tax=Nepenthes gracilis TaxID=150966 RepID=A0AAD3T8M7_NEPGR|nr:hypothetical protein Nepgr_026691 [Nepenthes gracilis]